MSRSVVMVCKAVRDMPRRVTNYFLEIDPSVPDKAEYALIMVRLDFLNLKHGYRYRVTFEEIAGPDESAMAAE